MDNLILFLVIMQVIASGVGAYLLARQAKKLIRIVEEVALVAFLIPTCIFIFLFSLNPTLEKIIFFINLAIYSLIANEITALPTAIIISLFRKRRHQKF